MITDIGSRNRGIWAAAAVCLAVAAGTVLYNINQSEKMPELVAARIQHTTPGVIMVRSGQVFPAERTCSRGRWIGPWN
jgi:negative regulator of sigma E activity